MPDTTSPPVREETLLEALERASRAFEAIRERLNLPTPPELRLMPTGDDAPPSGDPLFDRLKAAVDVLEAQAGRRRATLTVVREGGDDV